ncbi:hypothetical protein [uncultured Draconibacterium sp.]
MFQPKTKPKKTSRKSVVPSGNLKNHPVMPSNHTGKLQNRTEM